jgi:Xaa-Pro aminopeptidase
MRALGLLLFLLAQEAKDTLRLGAAEFDRRRAALAERLPDGAFAVDAGPLGEVGSDANTPLFDFKYLAGFHDPDGVLVVSGGRLTVFSADPAKALPGVGEAKPLKELAAWAGENLKGRVYTKLRRKNLDLLAEAAPRAELVGQKLAGELTKLRLVKGELEIRLMRKAAEATCRAHLAAMRTLKPGLNEKAVQDLVEKTFRDEGCPELGFPSICAAGKNGTILHYMKNNQEVPRDTLLVLDIGAAIENYVTDITRTLPTSGKFGEEQAKAYQCVLDAQKAAEALLRPGTTFGELERAARKVFEERGLTEWSYAHAKDFSVRHGLGHYVGMAVHDSGSYREKFEPGMVITIEPGWYDKARGYGIRIEDTYLVTKDGFERLSSIAPREIEEVEKAMAVKREF